MTSLTWGLVCFIGFLVSGTRGTSPQFGSHNLQIHTIRPLNPRASTQVPPRVYQQFEDTRSIEQTSDEVQSAESFEEARLGAYTVRGFQQQQQQQQAARPSATTYLMQEREGSDSRGWYPTLFYTQANEFRIRVLTKDRYPCSDGA